jgi:phage protein D
MRSVTARGWLSIAACELSISTVVAFARHHRVRVRDARAVEQPQRHGERGPRDQGDEHREQTDPVCGQVQRGAHEQRHRRHARVGDQPMLQAQRHQAAQRQPDIDGVPRRLGRDSMRDRPRGVEAAARASSQPLPSGTRAAATTRPSYP